MAQRLAERLLRGGPNLYYRSGAFAPFDPTKVFAGGARAERFSGMIDSIDTTKIMRDTAAVLVALDGSRRCATDAGRRRATAWAAATRSARSATFSHRVVAAASFHGASLATDKAGQPTPARAEDARQPVLGVAGSIPGSRKNSGIGSRRAFGGQRRLHPRSVRRCEARLRRTGHLVYDRAASERHWTTLVKLFTDTLWQQSIGV